MGAREAMKRRSFLGLLGGAVAAGPQSLGDLSLERMGITTQLATRSMEEPVGSNAGQQRWAKDRLKEIMGWPDKAVSLRKKTSYLHGLDPDVAALRSVSLTNKVRMSRELQFQRDLEAEKARLFGIVEGWWS